MAMIERVANAVAEYGAVGTLRICWDRLIDLGDHQKAKEESDEFDVRYNVETAREANGANLREATWYQASHHVRIADIVRRFGIGPEFTFIDIGSGKGRVVLSASMLPLKRSIGVEYDPELHRIALENAQRFNGTRSIDPEFVCADATAYTLPADPLLIFMNNPFTARLMQSFLENLRRSLADNLRPILIVYTWPFQRRLLEQQNWLRLIWDTGYCCIFRAIS